MLGLILIYFVGKAYYELAKKYNKTAWLYAVLGVVSYYAGIVAAVFSFIYYQAYVNNHIIDESEDMKYSLMSIPVGVVICLAFYQILKYNWKKKAEAIQTDEGLLDDDALLE